MGVIVRSVRRIVLSCFMAACFLMLSAMPGAGCTQGPHTSQRTLLRMLAVTPDGTWQDLVNMSETGRQYDAAMLFSRRYLLKAVDPLYKDITYKTDAEDYDEQLAGLEQRLEARRAEVEGFGRRVCESLRAMRMVGVLLTENPQGHLNPPYRDDNEYPRGPNAASLTVRYWPKGMGVGESQEWNVRVVQEYESWRIDRIVPDPFVPSAGGR